MKRFLKGLVLTVAVLGLAVPSFAAEGAVKFTRTVGGIRGPLTGDRSEVTSGSAMRVVGVQIVSGSSAAVLSLYDGSDRSNTTPATFGKGEFAAAANEGKFYDFSDAPLEFKTGIVSVTDGDEAGFVIYTES